MGTECFVGAVYGIYVDEEACQTQLEKLAALFEFDGDADDWVKCGDVDSLPVARFAQFENLRLQILEIHGLSVLAGLGLHYTYDPDEAPARCNAYGDSWLIGFGLYDFPLEEMVADKNEISCVLKLIKDLGAEWHTWATLG